MKLFDIILLAFKNLFRRKARTLLTVLGIVIGTVSVVIMFSIGLGLNESKKQLLAQFSSLEVITVYRKYSNEEGSDPFIGTLNDAAVEAFSQIDNVQLATPMLNFWDGTFISGKLKTMWTQIIAVKAEAMPMLEGYKLKEGRFIDPNNTGNARSIEILMGYEVPFMFYNPKKRNDRDQYWNLPRYYGEGEDTRALKVNPLEDSFKFTFDYSYGEMPSFDLESDVTAPIKKAKLYSFDVVGYLDYDTSYNTNDYIIMDIEDLKYLKTEYNKYTGNNNSGGGGSVIFSSVGTISGISSSMESGKEDEYTYDNVIVRATDMKHVSNIQKEIEKMGFSANSYMSYVEPLQDKIESDQFLFLSIGCIAFFVAALNIINTMMMSTYERTREIGIMKVLGCKIKNIRDLFLLEAGLMGTVGGALGIPISYLVSYIVNYMSAQSAMGDNYYYDPTMQATSSVIPPWLCFAAVLFAGVVGFISGLYPSIRAMKLSALDAIKNE